MHDESLPTLRFFVVTRTNEAQYLLRQLVASREQLVRVRHGGGERHDAQDVVHVCFGEPAACVSVRL